MTKRAAGGSKVSTDRKELVSGLGVRDNLLYIVDRWPRLAALVGGAGGGQALTGMPGCASIIPPLVVDIEIVNLMNDIEMNVARYYGHILMDETEWEPLTSKMPYLLSDVAMRYGHFTEDDDLTIGFCADAREYRAKVEKVLNRDEAPTYLGPCPTYECIGELYVGQGMAAGTCRLCGYGFSVSEQMVWLGKQMQVRLMTAAEISRALNVLGTPVLLDTIHKWTRRGRLVAVEDGLYSLADAKALAERGRGIAA